SLYPTEHMVVMLPKSMQFKAGPGSNFQSMQDLQQSDATVQVATRTEVGQQLSFEVSGSGVLQTEQEGGGQPAAAGAQGRDNRPGGGLGAPIDAPDPLEKYRWYILGGFGLVLARVPSVVLTRQPAAARGSAAAAGMPEVDIPSLEPARINRPRSASASSHRAASGGGRPSMLLEALKEELFKLEVEHKQGSITQQEYEKAKA